MPPGAGAATTPGTACSSDARVSRHCRRWATTRGVISSVRSSAATPARCTNTLAQEVLNSTSLPMSWVVSVGITSQPRRQPVIRKLLEKLCTTISRSSGVVTSRKLGAQPLAVSPA